MKKLLSTILCCLALLTLSILVLAAENENDTPDITVSSTATDEKETINLAPAALTGQDVARPPARLENLDMGIYPIDAPQGAFSCHDAAIHLVRYEMLGNIPYITRIYELEENQSVGVLPKSFEQEGYAFTQLEVLKKEIPGNTDTKTASKNVVAECEKNDTATLAATLAPTMEYSQDGYTGTLQLDPASIIFAEAGTERYSYRITDTREYPRLSANDMAYVPITVQKNGVTLELDGVEWQVSRREHPVSMQSIEMQSSTLQGYRTDPTDGGLVPTLYTAIASYSGSARGSRVSGYTATVQYTGEISKTEAGKVQYTLVYRGKEMAPVTTEQPKAKRAVFPTVLFSLLLIVAAGGGCFVLYKKGQQKGVNLTIHALQERINSFNDELNLPPYLYSGYGEDGEPEVGAEHEKEEEHDDREEWYYE